MAADPIIEDDAALVEALRAGDEKAFSRLVRRYHASLVRVAMGYVPGRAIAEEVAQETWLAVVEGIHRFEGRSSLKTWIFRILANRARSRGVKERRSSPFSSFAVRSELDGVSVAADQFLGAEGGE